MKILRGSSPLRLHQFSLSIDSIFNNILLNEQLQCIFYTAMERENPQKEVTDEVKDYVIKTTSIIADTMEVMRLTIVPYQLEEELNNDTT